MSSGEELESFEVTQDDLDNEFNPNRKTFRLSKNRATYGIWANPDSDNEGGRPSFGGNNRGNKDYTAPIGFVSGGVKVGDKVTKEEDGGGGGTDSDEEFDRSRFTADAPSGFAGRRGGGQFRGNRRGGGATFGPPGRMAGESVIGNWERHTKGIGQKLLERMGHVTGKGLGKNLQGICSPVEATKRKGKGAIGLYGSERTERSLKDYPTKPDSDEEEETEFKQQLQQWKRRDGDKKKKPKYIYKTADELVITGSKKRHKKEVPSHISKVKVIDMTGKEQRVLSGYQALSHKHDLPDEEDIPHSMTEEKKHFDMPELLHNLDLLVDMAGEAIIDNDRKLKYEKDMVVNLEHERQKMRTVCGQEEKYITRLKDVLSVVDKCEERCQTDSKNPLSLKECATIFLQLQEDYYEEYKMYGLSDLAIALVFPLMKREFEDWDPLQKPRHGMTTMKDWKKILEGLGQPLYEGQPTMDPYHRLVWEIWMPDLRTTIRSKWSVRECDALIEVLEAWLPMLPDWVLCNVLEQQVYPKLQQEVEDWNPLTDTEPIHAWLHPWLPLMGDRLEPLYGPIRHKLANALTNWHPSDPSAKMILEPWVKVFSQGHMDAFLMKNILPKLEMCLQGFIINPHEQHLDAWNWVMLWLDLMPLNGIVSILERQFFPKWQRVLSAWLTSAPNYNEVTKWYTGWKSQFREQLLSEPTIKDKFNQALEVMNRAVSGHFQPGARENVAYLTSTERRREFESQATQDKRDYEAIRAVTAVGTVPTSFKEMLERRAELYNIIFLPIPNRTHEAKQVYRFGNLQVYLDRNVVFLFENNVWVPVSLSTLVDKARY